MKSLYIKSLKGLGWRVLLIPNPALKGKRGWSYENRPSWDGAGRPKWTWPDVIKISFFWLLAAAAMVFSIALCVEIGAPSLEMFRLDRNGAIAQMTSLLFSGGLGMMFLVMPVLGASAATDSACGAVESLGKILQSLFVLLVPFVVLFLVVSDLESSQALEMEPAWERTVEFRAIADEADLKRAQTHGAWLSETMTGGSASDREALTQALELESIHDLRQLEIGLRPLSDTQVEHISKLYGMAVPVQ